MDLRLKCNGQQIDSTWVADALAAVGIAKFTEINPWFPEITNIRGKKRGKPKLTADQIRTQTILAHHWRELGADLRSKGWSVKDVAQLGIQQKKISRRQALDARKRANVEVDVVQSSPRSTILDNMYRFDKPPRVRHYDRKKK